ncbi:unnamed protein product [Brassica oleracea var. botrytis]
MLSERRGGSLQFPSTKRSATVVLELIPILEVWSESRYCEIFPNGDQLSDHKRHDSPLPTCIFIQRYTKIANWQSHIRHSRRHLDGIYFLLSRP